MWGPHPGPPEALPPWGDIQTMLQMNQQSGIELLNVVIQNRYVYMQTPQHVIQISEFGNGAGENPWRGE